MLYLQMPSQGSPAPAAAGLIFTRRQNWLFTTKFTMFLNWDIWLEDTLGYLGN